MNNKYLWGIVLFIVFPVAYYVIFASFIFAKMYGFEKDYLYYIYIVSGVCIVIISNILLLKKISKK